jgi:hypothetical protein
MREEDAKAALPDRAKAHADHGMKGAAKLMTAQ